jgi:hypothetical protein
MTGISRLAHSISVTATAACLCAAAASAQERETQLMESLPEHLLYLQEMNLGEHPDRDKANQLYADRRRWPNGQALKICFFGGGDSVRRLIAETAVEWTKFANLVFDFGPIGRWYDCLAPGSGFSHIRIGFSERGFWSAVGKDSVTDLGNQQPSMNFERFDLRYANHRVPVTAVIERASEEDKGTILHEFGHAIGLLHEHQNPALKCYDEIKWEGPDNVYDYLGGYPNFWSKPKVDRNLGRIGVTDPDYVAGAPDTKSIMMYAMDRKIFKNANSPCFVDANNRLSPKDQQVAAKIYPRIAVAVSETELSTTAYRAPAVRAAPEVAADYRARIVADLQSDQPTIRRDARSRLAQYLETAPQADISSIIRDMPSGNYRYQLGVAVALSQAKNVSIPVSEQATLESVLRRAGDPTLRMHMEKIGIAPNR